MNVVHPQCVGFIMDGNRRWAKAKSLPSVEGHRQGYVTLQNVIRMAHRAEIPHMVVYAFSTENWQRAQDEVEYLMRLMQKATRELTQTLVAEGKKINVRVIGEKHRLPETLQAEIARTEGNNTADPELTLWIAISYGGRADIVNAVNMAIRAGVEVDEPSFQKLLWTDGMPDPDLIIRTSGEMRISNFLLFQSAYSEYFFTSTLWPDFGETEFKSILEEFQQRQRRRGT